jgi:hypothetical protein
MPAAAPQPSRGAAAEQDHERAQQAGYEQAESDFEHRFSIVHEVSCCILTWGFACRLDS